MAFATKVSKDANDWTGFDVLELVRMQVLGEILFAVN